MARRRRSSRRKNPVLANPRKSRHSRRRRNPVLANPRHHRRMRRRNARYNPVLMNPVHKGDVGRMILNTIVVGGLAVATAIGLDALLAQPFAASLSAPIKATLKIGLGLAAGVAAGMALPKVPAVAAGLAVGGAVDGMRDLYDLYIAPRLLPAPAPTTTGQAGRLLGMGGMPAGFVGYNPAACGIRN
jgi:hypothetical protein